MATMCRGFARHTIEFAEVLDVASPESFELAGVKDLQVAPGNRRMSIATRFELRPFVDYYTNYYIQIRLETPARSTAHG